MGWLLPSKTTSWSAACSLHFQNPLIMCHGSNEVLLSLPGPSEALSSEVAPWERGRVQGGEAGAGLPQVLLGPMVVSPQAVGSKEKLAAGTRPACTFS